MTGVSVYLCRIDGVLVRTDQRALHEADHAKQAANTAAIATLQSAPAVSSRLAFHQETPAASWSWTHNLGGYPPVTLFTADDPTEPVVTDVSYPDANTLVVEWPEATAGWAYI